MAGGAVSRLDRQPAILAGALRGAALLAGGQPKVHGAVVLAYHDVAPAGAQAEGLTVTASDLEDHLTLVRRSGSRIVHLSRLVDALLGGRDVTGQVAVVFDDALVGVHHHGLPVLAALGVPATIFAVTSHVGTTPPWWPGSARTMTRAELAESVAAGCEISGHTRNHPSLPALSDPELADELGGGRAWLEDLAGRPLDLLAYPFGHHDKRVRDTAQALGYRAGFSFLNGRLVEGQDRFKLPRLTMHAGHTRARLAFHLARSSASWPDHQQDTVR